MYQLSIITAGAVRAACHLVESIGFAIHDDYTSARFHHVSLEYKLELDNPEAEINVVKQ